MGRELIKFWWPWPFFPRSLQCKDSKNEPCVRSISWINRWKLSKLAQIHYLDWGKKLLDFSDIYLISRSHWHFETQILIEKNWCAHFIWNEWLEFHQTSTDISKGYGEEVIKLRWPRPHFQDHINIKILKTSLVCTCASIDGVSPN